MDLIVHWSDFVHAMLEQPVDLLCRLGLKVLQVDSFKVDMLMLACIEGTRFGILVRIG